MALYVDSFKPIQYYEDRFPPKPRVVVVGCDMPGLMNSKLARKGIELGIRLGGGTVVSSYSISDGGDGFLDAWGLLRTGRHQTTFLKNDRGHLTPCEFLYDSENETAVLELGRACPLPNSSSAPLGELILRALALGARSLHIGIGGSNVQDAGAGMLRRLQESFGSTSSGLGVRGTPGVGWELELMGLRKLFADLTVRLYCSQMTPISALPGASLAAWVERLEQRSGTRLREVAGTAAGGGVGVAFAALGMRLQSGAQSFCDFIRLEEKVATCDGVVTCEGSFDRGSLEGRAPWHAAQIARRANKQALIACAEIHPESAEVAKRSGVRLLEFAASVPRERRSAEGFNLLQQTLQRLLLGRIEAAREKEAEAQKTGAILPPLATPPAPAAEADAIIPAFLRKG